MKQRRSFIVKSFLEVIYEILKIPFVQRISQALLLPNVLVILFVFAGLDSKRNYLWFHFIGPYWTFEKYCFYFTLTTLVLMSVHDVVAWFQAFKNDADADLDYQSPKQSSSFPTHSKNSGTENVVPIPLKSKPSDVNINCQRQEIQSPVPLPRKLTAEELRQKALKSFTGGDR